MYYRNSSNLIICSETLRGVRTTETKVPSTLGDFGIINQFVAFQQRQPHVRSLRKVCQKWQEEKWSPFSATVAIDRYKRRYYYMSRFGKLALRLDEISVENQFFSD